MANIFPIKISAIKPGDYILNLGEVLEISEKPEFYSFVINRMNEKQVIKFNKSEELWVLVNSEQKIPHPALEPASGCF